MVMTLNDWSVVMYQAMDSTEPHLSPKMDNRAWMCAYFVVYIIVASMFVLQLIVSVRQS